MKFHITLTLLVLLVVVLSFVTLVSLASAQEKEPADSGCLGWAADYTPFITLDSIPQCPAWWCESGGVWRVKCHCPIKFGFGE